MGEEMPAAGMSETRMPGGRDAGDRDVLGSGMSGAWTLGGMRGEDARGRDIMVTRCPEVGTRTGRAFWAAGPARYSLCADSEARRSSSSAVPRAAAGPSGGGMAGPGRAGSRAGGRERAVRAPGRPWRAAGAAGQGLRSSRPGSAEGHIPAAAPGLSRPVWAEAAAARREAAGGGAGAGGDAGAGRSRAERCWPGSGGQVVRDCSTHVSCRRASPRQTELLYSEPGRGEAEQTGPGST